MYLPDHTPAEGMTNEEWAKQIIFSLQNLGHIDLKTAFLEKALNHACIYSERPADRFAKAHVFKGHRIQAWKDRPGVTTVMCEQCMDSIDVDTDENAALILLLVERGLLPPPSSQTEGSYAGQPGTD